MQTHQSNLVRITSVMNARENLRPGKSCRRAFCWRNNSLWDDAEIASRRLRCQPTKPQPFFDFSLDTPGKAGHTSTLKIAMNRTIGQA